MFEFRLPDVGEGLHEAEIVRWRVAEGDVVQADQPFADIQTDKSVVELTVPRAGVIAKLHGREGDMIKVGAVIVSIAEPGEATTPGAAPTATPVPQPVTTAAAVAAPLSTVRSDGPHRGRWAPAAPSTRRLARELGVDVNALSGTGKDGRVTDDDVRAAAARAAGIPVITAPPASAPAPIAAPPAPAGAAAAPARAPAATPAPGTDTQIPLRGIRRTIAEHMVRSAQLVPHAVVVDEADFSALVALRGELAEDGQRLTYLPLVVKALVAALKEFPYLNARLDDAAQTIVLRGEYNIGIAVATEAGLVVPVVKRADQKSVLQIAAEVQDLSGRAREGRLTPADFQGGTFTISNIGAFGGLMSAPIINHPEVAILGVHKVQERPVGRNGQMVLRPMCYLSLSFDHRVIDGDLATRFLTRLIHLLEKPSRLFAELI